MRRPETSAERMLAAMKKYGMPLSVSRILMWAFGLMVAGLAICVGMVIWTAYDNITLAHRISVLTALDRRIFETRQALRIEFGAMQTALVMEDDPQAALVGIYRKLDTAAVTAAEEVARIDVPAARARLPILEEKLTKSRERWAEILAIGRRPKSERDLVDTKGWDLANTEVHDEFTMILDAIGGQLRLIDPVAAQYYLIHQVAWNYRVEAGRECSVNRPLIVSGTAIPPDRRKWTDAERTMVDTFRSLLDETLAYSSLPDTLMEAVKAADAPYRASIAAREAVYAKLGKATGAIIAPDEWRRLCNAPFQPILTIATTALDLMASHANARLRQEQLHLIGTAVILLIAIAATIVSLSLVRRRIHAPLATLIATTSRFSTGDFASAVPRLRGEDEFSTMAQTLEGLRLTALQEQQMRNRLEHLVEERTRSLRQSEAYLAEAQRLSRIGSFAFDVASNKYVYASEECVQIFELDAHESLPTRKAVSRLIHPEDWDRVKGDFEKLLREKVDTSSEFRIALPSGTTKHIQAIRHPVLNDVGEAVTIVGTVIDMTERRRAEAVLRESEERYRTLFEKANDAVFLENERDEIIEVNQRACALLGYSRDELLRMKVSDLQAPEIRSPAGSVIRREVEKHGSATFEAVDLHRSGRRIAVEVTNTPISLQGQRLVLSIVRDITERRRAEAELRASEERFRALVEFSFDVYWETDAQHRFTRQEFAEGLADAPAPGSEIGKTRWEMPYLEPDEEAWQQHRATMDAHLPFRDFELARPTPDGGKRYVSVSGLPVFDATGGFLGYRGVGRDITERKRAERALRQSQEYLAEAQRLSHTGSWALDVASGKYLYVSEEFCRIFGLDAQAGLPSREDFSRLIRPEDWDRANESFEKQLREKVDITIEYRIVLSSGAVKHIQAIRHPVLNEAGDVVQLVGTVMDVTERKRAEDALRQSEAYLAEAQRLSHTGSWAYDPAGGAIYWSEEMFRIYAFDPQQGPPTRAQRETRIHPDDLEDVKQARHGLLHEKVDSDFEHRIVLPDGTVRHVHVRGHPVLSPIGEVLETVGTTVDITDRKRAEEALRESETRFRTFVDHAADAFFMLDFEQGIILDVNRCACESLDYTREELVGMAPMAFHLNSDRAQVESAAERAVAGETVVDTHRHRRKDGSLFPVEVQTSLFWHGERRFLLKVARDISDRVRAEEERGRLRQLEADLAHINRVSLLGELTASIAHEVGQPLSGVVSNGGACLRWLGRDVPNLEEAREAAKRIVRDGKRAGDIIARIRAMTKKGAAPNEKLALNETIQDVLPLVGDEAKRKSVIIRTEFAADLAPVTGDRVQLQQVVLNLVVNGIEAMSSVEGRARELVITTRNLDPDEVQVTVEDSGTGLDPSILERIFDPFYTTKPNGMGMGLSICRSILQSHDGRLWATAKDGPGTMFHLTLPKYRGEESDD